MGNVFWKCSAIFILKLTVIINWLALKGSSTNDVTALGGGVNYFLTTLPKLYFWKCDDIEWGCQILSKNGVTSFKGDF